MQLSTSPLLPGLRFEVRGPAAEVTPLRTDIAGFAGQTLRGPVSEPVRVTGWRHFMELFGGLTFDADTAYALRGYFENGGEVAYVIRLLGAAAVTVTTAWRVGEVDAVSGNWSVESPGAGGFTAIDYAIDAATPGVWAEGMRIELRYRLRGDNGRPGVDIDVRPLTDAPEQLLGLPPDNLVEAVAARSRLIRLRELNAAPPAGPLPGPRVASWVVDLPGTAAPTGASDPVPTFDQYVQAAGMLAAEREVALMALPDLYAMEGGSAEQGRVVATLVAEAEAVHDRQVLGFAAPGRQETETLLAWVAEQRIGIDRNFTRSLALYHPWLRVPDPLGGVINPLREISPVGHVAGVISRLDRERGAHYTPANASIFEAVDLADQYTPDQQGIQAAAGLNPLRCADGHGLLVWGGRTAFDPEHGTSGLFLAHRRLIHRLIRAIRRVAEPLVFDTNGPALWLKLVRAITSVLLEAYRAGALKGERPEQAFLVRCDETTNPAESQDLGRVNCEVYLAPATPMEFIALRIAVSQDGELEVIEA